MLRRHFGEHEAELRLTVVKLGARHEEAALWWHPTGGVTFQGLTHDLSMLSGPK
jgi:hypothetical protein